MIEPSPLRNGDTTLFHLRVERRARFLAARLKRQEEALIARQLRDVDAAVLRGSGEAWLRVREFMA
jgi:hypothetical protein